jgi:hypothetical protein
MPVSGRGDRSLGELAAGFIDGNDGVRSLVRIDSNDDHVAVFLFVGVDEDRSADTPELGRSHAPVKSRRPVQYVRRPAEHIVATHTAGSHSESQAAGRDSQ